MLGYHCGRRLTLRWETRFAFCRTCSVCHRVFIQRKRLPMRLLNLFLG